MTEKFSPSAFHHGKVHGCFSARGDLLIQESSLSTKAVIVAWAGITAARKLVGHGREPVGRLLLGELLYCLSDYAHRRTKMCGLRELRLSLSNGSDFH